MDGERVFKIGSDNDLILTEHGGVQPEFPKRWIIPPLCRAAGLYYAAGDTRILFRGEEGNGLRHARTTIRSNEVLDREQPPPSSGGGAAKQSTSPMTTQ